MDLINPPKNMICALCNKRAATHWWTDEGAMGVARGYCSARCERCVVETQLEHARKVSANIPKLEARLRELDGT